jgi:hypothetical protein
MTDDLVKRLRRDLASGLSASIGDTKAAADRIEKLDAALRAVLTHCEYDYPPNVEALKLFVRTALDGE